MAIKMDGHTITALQLKASDGSEVTKQLTEEGTIPTPTESLSITANGTYDVTDKASAVVNVPAPEINLQTKTATTNGDVVADAGYDGLEKVIVAVSGDVPTLITKSITANGTYPASADNADGYSSVTVNVSGGGSSDIMTNWFTIKTAEVVMPANTIGNAQAAVAYFEQIYGANNILGIYLKNSKASYANQQLVALKPYVKSDNNNSVIDGKGYRINNNEPQQFTTSSGYSCSMPEGETYTVLYYSVSI